MSALNNPILSLKKSKAQKLVAPESCGFRFIDRKGRYILQICLEAVWYDIPMVGSLSKVEVVKP